MEKKSNKIFYLRIIKFFNRLFVEVDMSFRLPHE
jgi:hypothetical protein